MSSSLFPSHPQPPTYTIGAATWQNSSISNTTADTIINASGHLELRGEKADVVINGVSLSATLKGIQDRLNILQPNSALEAEWDELRELGELYRRKETELKEKQRMWEIMKRAE
jgi:hypothetical protein